MLSVVQALQFREGIVQHHQRATDSSFHMSHMVNFISSGGFLPSSRKVPVTFPKRSVQGCSDVLFVYT